MKTAEFANRVYLDEVAHDEPPSSRSMYIVFPLVFELQDCALLYFECFKAHIALPVV